MWKFVVLSVFLVVVKAQEPGVLESTVKFLGQCGDKDLSVCLKEKALRAIETASGDVEITEGITLKKDETAVETPVEEPVLPEEGRARESAIDGLLMDRVVNFLTSHTLEFKVPKNTADDVKRSLEEARRKKGGKKGGKKMLMPLLLLLKLKAAIFLPIILGAIAFIAFKALIIGKIALVLSLISAVKKLLKGKGGESYDTIIAHPGVGHGHAGGFGHEEFHGHDAHHGHFARSIDAQNLAYNAYATNSQ